MIDAVRPYQAIKPSGVSWLGDIPQAWNVIRLKRILREVDLRSEDGSADLLSVSQYTGVTRRSDNVSDGESLLSRAPTLVGYKCVSPGDIVVNIMLAWNGSIGVSPVAGLASPAYCVYRRTTTVNPTFLHYLFRTSLYKQVFRTVSTGVVDSRLRLYSDVLLRLQVPIPSVEEQGLIVRFLRYADRQMQRYIEAKRRIIALLNEQKQAIIHRALNHGLGHDASFRPSGVEWLANIPEHWDVVPFKRVASVQGGYAFQSSAFGDVGVPVVRMNNLRRGRLNLESVVRVPTEACNSQFSLRAGDILFGLSGSIGATGSLGNFAIVDEALLPLQLNQRVARFHVNESRLLPEFLLLLLQAPTFMSQVVAKSTGAAQFNVSGDDIGSISVALPPLAEQLFIVAELQRSMRTMDQCIKANSRAIKLCRDWWDTVCSAVATGKLDVQQAATNLPHGMPEEQSASNGGDVIEADEEMLAFEEVARGEESAA